MLQRILAEHQEHLQAIKGKLSGRGHRADELVFEMQFGDPTNRRQLVESMFQQEHAFRWAYKEFVRRNIGVKTNGNVESRDKNQLRGERRSCSSRFSTFTEQYDPEVHDISNIDESESEVEA